MPRHVLAARAGALEPGLGAGAALARLGHGALRGAQRLHAGLEGGVGLGERIGGDLALALGRAERDQELACGAARGAPACRRGSRARPAPR